jgi:hypothetical protein
MYAVACTLCRIEEKNEDLFGHMRVMHSEEESVAFRCPYDRCSVIFIKDHHQDIDYEPTWGSICIKRMIQRHKERGFSDDGVASIMLGYLFM